MNDKNLYFQISPAPSDERSNYRTPMQWNANANAGFTSGASTWLPVGWLQQTLAWSRRVLLIGMFVRFALPVLIVGSNLVFDQYLATEQQAALDALQSLNNSAETNT